MQKILGRQNMKIFGIRSHSNNMFIGLVVVPSPLISNLYEISSLNIQNMIRRVNDRGSRSSMTGELQLGW